MFLHVFLGNPLIYLYDWTSTQPETDQKYVQKYTKNTSKNTSFFTWFLTPIFMYFGGVLS